MQHPTLHIPCLRIGWVESQRLFTDRQCLSPAVQSPQHEDFAIPGFRATGIEGQPVFVGLQRFGELVVGVSVADEDGMRRSGVLGMASGQG